MDKVRDRIKAHVLTVMPEIIKDVGGQEKLLNYFIEEVIDRSIVHMNRGHLITPFTKLQNDYAEGDEYWDTFQAYPVPPLLERPLARAVISTIRTVKKQNVSKVGAVKSVKDRGQSVTFSDRLTTYFSGVGDEELFGSTRAVLDRYKLGRVARLG